MRSQLILTRYGVRISSDSRFSSCDERDVFYCEDYEYRLFGPLSAERYYNEPFKFVDKFLGANYSESQVLYCIPPEQKDSELCQKAEIFKEYIIATGKAKCPKFLGELGKNVPITDFKLLGEADIKRGIAKIAFHWFLAKKPEYTGHELIFSNIKTFIKYGNYDGEIPVIRGTCSEHYNLLGDVTVAEIINDTQCKVFHVLSIYENNRNITCVIEFFVGTTWSVAFTIYLVGGYDESLG